MVQKGSQPSQRKKCQGEVQRKEVICQGGVERGHLSRGLICQWEAGTGQIRGAGIFHQKIPRATTFFCAIFYTEGVRWELECLSLTPSPHYKKHEPNCTSWRLLGAHLLVAMARYKELYKSNTQKLSNKKQYYIRVATPIVVDREYSQTVYRVRCRQSSTPFCQIVEHFHGFILTTASSYTV